jgi:hypothetical protein
MSEQEVTRGRRSPMFGESRFPRAAEDSYMTPDWLSAILVEHVPLREPIWEPAVGTGQMAEVLKRKYKNVVVSDIKDYGYYATHIMDFLDPDLGAIGEFRSIITNPPFYLAREFLELALARADMVCLLLRNEFDCAKKRLEFVRAPTFARKIVITKRPQWFPDTSKSPRFHFAWYVWDSAHEGPPTLAYK